MGAWWLWFGIVLGFWLLRLVWYGLVVFWIVVSVGVGLVCVWLVCCVDLVVLGGWVWFVFGWLSVVGCWVLGFVVVGGFVFCVAVLLGCVFLCDLFWGWVVFGV